MFPWVHSVTIPVPANRVMVDGRLTNFLQPEMESRLNVYNVTVLVNVFIKFTFKADLYQPVINQ